MEVETAAGPIAAADMGHTLTHEHIFVNMLMEYRETGWLNDYPLMVEEVKSFKQAGGATIIDVSTAEMTRGAAPDPAGALSGQVGMADPEDGSRSESNVLALRRLSEDTGLNIIIGAGHYRDPYFEETWFNRHNADMIAERIVRDIQEGIGQTGIRAGIIGEIGADKWYISPAEERSFRAAARAQKRTGVAITTHAARWPIGIAQLDLLESEGVDLRRVIVGHCDSVNIPGYHEALAKRGAYVQYDTIRGNTEYDTRLRLGFVLNMIENGLIDHVLMSHDICRRSQLHIHAAGGFDFIPTVFSKLLVDAGLSKEQVHQICIENPRRAVAGG